MTPDDISETKLSRQELYDQIWTTPTATLAIEFGVSDVGLAKICKRHNIPRPPRGYWARLQNGYPGKKPPLPQLNPEGQGLIRISRHGISPKSDDSKCESTAKVKIEVPEVLNQPHSLVVTARQLLQKSKTAEDGTITSDSTLHLSIRVTRKSLDRALRIYDTLIKHWESLGGHVLVGVPRKYGSPTTDFEFQGDQVPVELSEEISRIAKDPHAHSHFKYRNCNYEATGRLTLQIAGATWGMRTRWGDGKVRGLESSLDSFIAGVQLILATQRVDRLDNECVARQKEIVNHVREAVNYRKQTEERRRKQLHDDLNGWKISREIRSYLSEIEAGIAAGKAAISDPDAFAEWSRWAHWYADFVDPLRATSPHPDNPPMPRNVPVSELDLTRKTRQIVDNLEVDSTDRLFCVERAKVSELSNSWMESEWDEICRVLEGLHYDVSNRYKAGN